MKFWILICFLPTLAWSFTPTSQQDCSPLDLRDSSLGQVRNQKEISWCYAFTGADMLAHTFGINEKISAADVAIGYNQTKVGLFMRWLDVNLLHRKDPTLPQMPHQNGFNKASLSQAMKDGWCPERILPSEAWNKMSRTAQGWTSSEVPLDQAMLEIAALHSVRDTLTPNNLPYYYSFKNVDSDVFLQLIQTKNVADIYSSLRKTVCHSDRHPYPSQYKTKMVIKGPRIFKVVSEQMEAGRVVGLDYDSRILKDSLHHGFSLSELHTSGLVARRWNHEKNSCELLIRNSYGKTCGDRYDSSYECDAGNLWLSESQIYTSMTSVVYMQSP